MIHNVTHFNIIISKYYLQNRCPVIHLFLSINFLYWRPSAFTWTDTYVWLRLCTDQWQVMQGWCTSKSMIVFAESGQHVLLFFPPLPGILLQLQHNTDSALRRWHFHIYVFIKGSYPFEKHTCLPKVRMQVSALSICSNSLSFSLSAKGCWIWTEKHIQHSLTVLIDLGG